MAGLWFGSPTGRSLLRGRLRRRSRPIGACPRCGCVLEDSTECWFDAERIVAEHLSTCPVERPEPVAESRPAASRPRAILRPA